MDIFECTVEEFLKAIPDPITEFSSHHYPRADYEQNAEIYLMTRYQDLDPEIIKHQLQMNSYNLTSVSAELEDKGFVLSSYSLDKINLHHPPSIYFLQEVWFIEHRSEVLDVLDSALKAIQSELDKSLTYSTVVEVFECEICTDDITDYSQLGTCDKPAGHLFCKTCIKRDVEIRLAEGHTTFPCLVNCGGFIDLSLVKEVLPTEKFNILTERILIKEIKTANVAALETCPFCFYAYCPGDEEGFTCLNPTCMKQSCRVCRKDYHSRETCPMYQNENEEEARHFIENKMTEALVRQCKKCGKGFVKSDGCNKITCCGVTMCYVCRQTNITYSHFKGQGGDIFNKCELYSDEETIHEQPVTASAVAAFNQIVADNPGIKLDASKVIPK